jgi:cell division protein FtsW
MSTRLTAVAMALAVGALLILRGAMLLSVALASEEGSESGPQWEWVACGVVACALVAACDYRRLGRGAGPWVVTGLAALLLAAVLTPWLGLDANGARRWLRWGGQPSELGKIALVVGLAAYCAAQQPAMGERLRGFVYPGLIVGLFVGLVFLEPDWGTAILLATVGLAMLFVAGTHWGYLLSGLIIGGEVFLILLCRNPVRLGRVLALLDSNGSREGVGWQSWQSVLSMGAGGFWGRGLGEGKQKFGFVPEQHTDFILSLVGEELGFVGTTVVVLAFLCLALGGLRIAWRTTDPFGHYLAIGCTFLLGCQAAMNIGVATSVLPNKGIALPLLSYGGSSLVAMLTCIGLTMSVALHAGVEDSS